MSSLSTTDILPLSDHRARRQQRLRVATALHATDSARAALVSHLAEVAELVAADRVSALWVDEYGPGIPHPHVVVDLLMDRPRRSFQAGPLRTARENGVPGVCEYRRGDGQGRSGDWGLVVSLGSDGTRAWFLVADSVSPRPSLTDPVRNEVMFLSGECSAVVLHRDLDEPADGALRSAPGEDGRRFPGWHVLRDLEGRDEDSEEGRRIALRFLVVRLAVLLVEDGLALPDERRADQARRAREELQARGNGAAAGAEGDHWASLLDAFEDGDLPALGHRLFELGLHVEAQGHLHGAGEILGTGYEVAAAAGDTELAIDAARMAGRAARHRSRWSEAHRWYETARVVAAAVERPDRVAVVMEGVAITHRERGNLPAARTTLEEALALAEASRNNASLGRVHHGFLGLEQAAGNLEEAVYHGWRAVSLYEEQADRTRALAGLGGLFEAMGRLDASRDAWLLVRHLSAEEYYTLYAVDALSHLSALAGDAAGFARWAAEADALGWESGSEAAKAEILLYRGLSHQALGHGAEARRWLERAVAFAEEAGFSRTLFRAEAALGGLESTGPGEASRREAPPAPRTGEVEEGLRAMRRELVGPPA